MSEEVMNKIRIELTHPQARIPTKAHESDAGYDLYAVQSCVIKHDKISTLNLRFRMQLPHKSFAMIVSRSGCTAVHGVIVANSPGIIDEHYRLEVRVILTKVSRGRYRFETGDRVAQMLFFRLHDVEFLPCWFVDISTRGGLGSTGK